MCDKCAGINRKIKEITPVGYKFITNIGMCDNSSALEEDDIAYLASLDMSIHLILNDAYDVYDNKIQGMRGLYRKI